MSDGRSIRREKPHLFVVRALKNSQEPALPDESLNSTVNRPEGNRLW